MKHRIEIMDALIDYYIIDKVSKKRLSRNNCTYHHQLHNTRGNRENYPLFIDSLCNGLPVAAESIGKDNRFVITDQTAARFEAVFQAVKELFENEEVELMLLLQDIGLIWKDSGK